MIDETIQGICPGCNDDRTFELETYDKHIDTGEPVPIYTCQKCRGSYEKGEIEAQTDRAKTESSFAHRLSRALEDNKGVWVAPDDELVAVWCGGPTINIYDARTWETVETRETGVAYRTDDQDEIENAVHCRLTSDGFVRDGRKAAEKHVTDEVKA